MKAIQAINNKVVPNIEPADSSDVEMEDDQLIVHQCEDDGFEYMMEWIARKVHDEFPYMGSYTYKLSN